LFSFSQALQKEATCRLGRKNQIGKGIGGGAKSQRGVYRTGRTVDTSASRGGVRGRGKTACAVFTCEKEANWRRDTAKRGGGRSVQTMPGKLRFSVNRGKQKNSEGFGIPIIDNRTSIGSNLNRVQPGGKA